MRLRADAHQRASIDNAVDGSRLSDISKGYDEIEIAIAEAMTGDAAAA